jgi:hypothetical protein
VRRGQLPRLARFRPAMTCMWIPRSLTRRASNSFAFRLVNGPWPVFPSSPWKALAAFGSDKMADRSTSQSWIVVSTTFVAFLTGFMLGVYSIRGYLISPALVEERRRNNADPVESEESDIDEDDTILDHAPNWANGEEADRRDGLRQRKKETAQAAKSATPVEDGDPNEECKLVLVVRTDLGMTKGKAETCFSWNQWLEAYRLCYHRQDCCPMFTRDSCVLQDPFPSSPEESCFQRGSKTAEMGETGTGKDCGSNQERGRNASTDGHRTEPRYHRGSHPRCGQNTDRSRQHDSTWCRSCSQESCRQGHIPLEAVMMLSLLFLGVIATSSAPHNVVDTMYIYQDRKKAQLERRNEIAANSITVCREKELFGNAYSAAGEFK